MGGGRARSGLRGAPFAPLEFAVLSADRLDQATAEGPLSPKLVVRGRRRVDLLNSTGSALAWSDPGPVLSWPPPGAPRIRDPKGSTSPFPLGLRGGLPDAPPESSEDSPQPLRGASPRVSLRRLSPGPPIRHAGAPVDQSFPRRHDMFVLSSTSWAGSPRSPGATSARPLLTETRVGAHGIPVEE